jgi:hypothetical protein
MPAAVDRAAVCASWSRTTLNPWTYPPPERDEEERPVNTIHPRCLAERPRAPALLPVVDAG